MFSTPASLLNPPSRSPFGLLSWVSVWLIVCCNWALWSTLWALPELTGLQFAGFALLLLVALWAAFVGLGSLLAWRYTLKPFLIISLIVAAVCSYFMVTYKIIIDRSMIVNALQTDTKESFELLNWRMLVFVGLLGVLPSVWVWRSKVSYPMLTSALKRNLFTSIGALSLTIVLVWLGFQNLAVINRSHTQLRYSVTPFNAYVSTFRALNTKKPSAKLPLQAIGTDVSMASRSGLPPLLVLVVGETARADRFGINGYARDTTPKLKALSQNEGVASFGNAWSCGTNTAASVPCMFSSLGKTAFESSDARLEGLLHLIQRAGMGVAWIDNQAGCKGVCENLPTVDIAATPAGKQCAGGECRDTTMLPELSAQLSAMSPAQRARGVVLVMHQMGSHGPAYYKRTDALHKTFKPECASNALPQCDLGHVNNTYDNTIVATDDFLAQTIDWARAQTAFASALVYVSDHGESLGENGLFLHGLPYAIAPDVQKHVPWISWFSNAYTQNTGVSTACLAAASGAKISHDHYFHSVLGLLGLQTALYQPNLDAYKGCYK